MKRTKGFTTLLILLLFVTIILSACKALSPEQSEANTNETTTQSDSKDLISMETFKEEAFAYFKDSFDSWDPNQATNITFQGDQVVIDKESTGACWAEGILTIQKPGTYVFTGNLEDGQILVNSTTDGKVVLVLNQVDLTSKTSAPIYVKQASKTVLLLADGSENYLEDATVYTYDLATEEEPRSAIFSNDDLILSGTGSLTIQGNFNDAINVQDTLYVENGQWILDSKDDGLVGNDGVLLKNGTLLIQSGGAGIKVDSGFYALGGEVTVVSTGDALHSNDLLLIEGGQFELTSEDDGIHADTTLQITDGRVEIKNSYEGLESAQILVSGGAIRLVSQDDGINVAGGQDGSSMGGRPDQNSFTATENQFLTISGGEIMIDSLGDGIDVNGSMSMSGGKVVVYGPTSSGNGALDYDGTFALTGGVLMAAGSAGMAQGPSQESSQYSVMMTYENVQAAGTKVELKDGQGNVLLSMTSEKAFQSIVFSSTDLVEGGSYQLGSESFTLSEVLTKLGAQIAGGGFGGPNAGGGRGTRGEKVQPDSGTLPTVQN